MEAIQQTRRNTIIASFKKYEKLNILLLLYYVIFIDLSICFIFRLLLDNICFVLQIHIEINTSSFKDINFDAKPLVIL